MELYAETRRYRHSIAAAGPGSLANIPFRSYTSKYIYDQVRQVIWGIPRHR